MLKRTAPKQPDQDDLFSEEVSLLLPARLALEAKAQLAYNSQPSAGRDKKDLRYILGVGWTF